jgi:hypothetical protein
VSVLIRKITLAALMAALVGGTLALPASSKPGPVAHASKCKKKKHRSAESAKKKKCKGGSGSGAALPGQATHPNVTPPVQTPTATVTDVTLASNPVLDGDSTTGQVTISGPAPSGGQPVGLQSDTTRASVPENVVVAAGQTSAAFPVTTTSGLSATATLIASSGTSSDQVVLSIVSDPSVASVSLERHCLATGDSTDLNQVTLDVSAPPGNTTVLLDSDAPLSLAPAPSTTVPSGNKTAFFSVLAGAPSPLVTVSAMTATQGPPPNPSDTASVNGSTTVPTLTGVTVQPSTIPVGTQSAGTVTLDCEPGPGGALVDLSSDQAGVAAPSQSTVLVPAGQLSAPFTVNTSSIGNANIIATFGASTQQAPVTVIPIDT